jgi:hypothetical protein
MIVQWAVTVNMSFSYEEYSDMRFVYGFCNGNTTAAVEEYRLWYPVSQLCVNTLLATKVTLITEGI